ncbi:hypothetical protein [Aureimonas leprariae]|uniref:Uncharacterized protein n=1 Tax=Plantimonas leprariae TaxID=2615207 RepID=A0A7V7PMG7_9HYPH|nr:hypothetical protein [Aureimonas leprariae]KAB0678440.1 hypothetical protein F6X38_15500 [Aureimonas leprariae]
MSSEPPDHGSPSRGGRRGERRRQGPANAGPPIGVRRRRLRTPAQKAVPRAQSEIERRMIVELPDPLPVTACELDVLERYLGRLIDGILNA